jgi:hypothetical protein
MSHLQPFQARTADPTPYELKLAGAIEEVFGSGRHDLHELVDGLNELGVPAPGGETGTAQTWTAQTFTTEIKRLASPDRPAGKGA